MIAHRLHEVTVLRSAMVMTAGVFAIYPFAGTPWWMAGRFPRCGCRRQPW
jgi:hypothetical protein